MRPVIIGVFLAGTLLGLLVGISLINYLAAKEVNAQVKPIILSLQACRDRLEASYRVIENLSDDAIRPLRMETRP